MKITKKKIFLGLLALELIALPASIPATAQVMDKVFFSVPPRAAYAPVDQAPGQVSFVVASNAPFSIISHDMVGELEVDIQVNGEINGTAFGTAAQDPGMPDPCVMQTNAAPTKIYDGFRKTADRRGAVIDQAVLVTIKYDKSANPSFDIKPSVADEVKTAAPIQICSAARV